MSDGSGSLWGCEPHTRRGNGGVGLRRVVDGRHFEEESLFGKKWREAADVKLGGNSRSNRLGLYPCAGYQQVTGLDRAQNYTCSGSKLLPFISGIFTPTELRH